MSCPVCLGDFQNPVVLPCGHSLCQGWCSNSLIDSNKITCPKCRSTHWVPEGEDIPKNYDLLQLLEEKSTADIVPKCEAHPEDMISMFCTECYIPVCVRCYVDFKMVAADEADEPFKSPLHKDHPVIPLDKRNSYIQDLVLMTNKYLKYKQEEELNYLEDLLETGETLKEVADSKCKLIKQKTKRLKQLLEENSRHHIESLQTSVQQPQITQNSDQSLSRLQTYSDLIDQCEYLSQNDISKGSIDIKKFLSSLERIPECDMRPDPRCYLNTAVTLGNSINDDITEAVTAIQQCYNPQAKAIPRPPSIELDDCVVSNESISVSWKYNAQDKVGYFTVYYQTAIFVHGKCSDQTSTIVTDFGRSTGHVTVRDLSPDARYRLYVTANNELGESSRSDYLYFKASSLNPEINLF